MAKQLPEGVKRSDIYKIPISKLVIDHTLNTRFDKPSAESRATLKHLLATEGQKVAIGVEPWDNGTYRVRYGFQRADLLLEIAQETSDDLLVKAEIIKADDATLFEDSVSENVRTDLSPMDYAHIIQVGSDKYGKSLMEMATKFGKSEAWASQKLKLLTLPKKTQQAIHNGELGENSAWTIAAAVPSKKDELVEEVHKVIEEKKAAAPPPPPTPTAQSAQDKPKAAKKKKPEPKVSDTEVRRLARNIGAMPEDRAPERKMKELKNYLEETIETEQAGSPIRDLAKSLLAFIRGDISEAQMDNRFAKFCGIEATKAVNELKKGKK